MLILTGETITEDQIRAFKVQLATQIERGADTYADRLAYSLCIKAAIPRMIMPMLSAEDHSETSKARSAVAALINARNGR